jgi:mRNA-degrading endonuclease YafQ of YafQ-DinJ toxin-antitoxin module
MGIFTSIAKICSKCGKPAVFDGPFSDCSCYSPKPSTEEEAEKELAEAQQMEALIEHEAIIRIADVLQDLHKVMPEYQDGYLKGYKDGCRDTLISVNTKLEWSLVND